MSARKYSFSHLTEQQLDAIAAKYPKAVETVTIRKPVYKILAMLAKCGAPMPEGVDLQTMQEPEKTGDAEAPAMPAFLKPKA